MAGHLPYRVAGAWCCDVHAARISSRARPDLRLVEMLTDPGARTPAPRHGPAGMAERDAAALAAPRAGSWRWRVLAAVAAAGSDGCTDWEIHRDTGGNLYTVAPRRGELVAGGWIVDSGRRRETNTGTKATVWVLSEQGRVAYEDLWRRADEGSET